MGRKRKETKGQGKGRLKPIIIRPLCGLCASSLTYNSENKLSTSVFNSLVNFLSKKNEVPTAKKEQ
jgi:MarR-like DNA-binding transcriptional regulator SgrR of sgrS sRNA